MAFLTLWSMVSLVVIIVWSTWPYMRSLTQCQAARQAAVEKSEGARVMREKERRELQETLDIGYENQTKLHRDLELILEKLRETNSSLTNSLQEREFLSENFTALRRDVDMHRGLQKNLSSTVKMQEVHSDALEANLTWSGHHWNSCNALLSAAINNQAAAESLNRACMSASGFLLKQLRACKIEVNKEGQTGYVEQ